MPAEPTRRFLEASMELQELLRKQDQRIREAIRPVQYGTIKRVISLTDAYRPLQFSGAHLTSSLARLSASNTTLPASRQLLATNASISRLVEAESGFRRGAAALVTGPSIKSLSAIAPSLSKIVAFSKSMKTMLDRAGTRSLLLQSRNAPVLRSINRATLALEISARSSLTVPTERWKLPYVAMAARGTVQAGLTAIGGSTDDLSIATAWEVHPHQIRTGIHAAFDGHPGLQRRAQGMWDALRHDGPDARSQAAHSMQELLDGFLRAEAPEDAVRIWCTSQYPAGLVEGGRVTRAGRVRYLCHARGIDVRVAEPLAEAVVSISVVAQAEKHSSAPSGEQLGPLMLALEGLLGYMAPSVSSSASLRDPDRTRSASLGDD